MPKPRNAIPIDFKLFLQLIVGARPVGPLTEGRNIAANTTKTAAKTIEPMSETSMAFELSILFRSFS
jgi:hypothetical protein